MSETVSAEGRRRERHAEDARTVAAGASLSVVGKILGRALHVLTQVVLARALGPGTFGMYAIGWSILRVATPVAPLGLDRAILLFAAQGEASGSG